MKQLFMSLLLALTLAFNVKAQMVNEKGEKSYVANVAVVVNESMYNIDGGKMLKVDVRGRETLKSALTLWLSQLFSQNGFLIVNSDESVNAKINAIIEENKLEEYIDGLAVQAKNLGAQFMVLVDYSLYLENNKYASVDFSFRLIDVNTNIAAHRYVSHQAVCNDVLQLSNATATAVSMFRAEFNDFFNGQFLPQFVVSEVKGKKAKMFCTRPIPLKKDLVVNYYKWYYEPYYFQGQNLNFCVLDYLTYSAPLGKAKYDTHTGAVRLKTDTAIKANPQEILAIGGVKWFSVGTELLNNFFTFIELPYNEKSPEGYARKSVNQAIYNAITNTPNYNMIIESSLLPELKAERERQKDEAFMYVENNARKKYLEAFQTGAFGAQFLIDVDNFKIDKSNWKKVSFTLNLHSVGENAQLKSVDISCHISNLKDIIQYHINQYLNTPVSIAYYDKKSLAVYSPMYLKANVGEVFILQNYMEITNPMTGEISYQRTPVAEYEYLEWKGQKHVFELKKVLNKDLYKQMDKLRERDKEARANFSLFKKMEEPKRVDKDNSAFSKSEKASKVMNALGIESIKFQY